MDKARIYGVFEFVGFHFCKRLLEKGFYVEGIHVDTDSDVLLEEKRLEVGRNANFKETACSETGKATDVLILPLYDWFMTKSYKKVLPKIMEELQEQDELQLVFFLPIQLLTDGQDSDGIEEIKDFLNKAKSLNHSIQYFYLPTIFGPWQPSSFLFQRALLNQFNEKFELREWPFDAIYIDDLLNPVIEIIESGESGNYLLDSGIPKSWELCAEYLKLDVGVKGEALSIQNEDEMKRQVLKYVTPYAESLAVQKEHVLYVHNLMDE